MFARALLCRVIVTLTGAVLFFTAVQSIPVANAADKETANKEIKVAGILMKRQNDAIMVKADGEDEPVKYLISPSDKKLVEAMTHIFDAARVQLTYKQDGETRQLVSIKRQIFKQEGTITGSVVKVYNEFWVEVKPKTGLSDAYAPGLNYNDKAFMEQLKGLKPGDVVTIKYNTDFERHRIISMTVNKKADATSLDTGSLKTGSPAKK